MAPEGLSYNLTPLHQRLKSLESSFTTPVMFAQMNTIHHYFVNKSQAMFDGEYDPDGNPWAPLKRVTISRRMRLGFGPKPINVRTGLMKRYITEPRADIIGDASSLSYAFPSRSKPSQELLTRLSQASGLIRGGPARRVIGMSEQDTVFVLTSLRNNIMEFS